MLSQPVSLARFFVSAVVIFLLLVLAWIPVSDWTSYPAGGIARIGLVSGGGSWVRSASNARGLLQVDTRVVVPVAGRAGVGELVAEVRPAHYGYGLPLYLALLIASRGRRFLLKAAAGYLALMLAQAFSVSFDVLKQIMVVAGSAGPQSIAAWRMEAIALGYQFGALLLPTLAPIALWIGFERRFITAVIVEGFLIRATKDDKRTLAEDKTE